MLIKFRSPHAAEFLMFGEVALGLIKSMGCSGDIPGAIKAEDIPAALARLTAAITRAESASAAPVAPAQKKDEDTEPHVSLGHRALPLIQMLEAAQAGDSYVMWER